MTRDSDSLRIPSLYPQDSLPLPPQSPQMAFFLFGFVSRKVAWYEGFWADLPRSLTISHAHP